MVCPSGTPNCYGGACSTTCSPTGTRQGFNTLSSGTANGCWMGNPCPQTTYLGSTTNGRNFKAINQDVVCGGTTACVNHVGITTYAATTYCQGGWDVYCDSTKVGNIDTTGKMCIGNPMTNGCSITFAPLTCSTIKYVGVKAGGGICCNTGSPDIMITATAAW